MLDYTKMNSLIDSLRSNIQKLCDAFNVDVVRQLWLLTMASLAGCECVNNNAGKEERERLAREYQNAKDESEDILGEISSLRKELESFYYQWDCFVTESPLWFFVEAPDDYWKMHVSEVDDRFNEDFVFECMKLGILKLKSVSGGTCGDAEYKLSHVDELLSDLSGLVRGYKTLDKVVTSCLESGTEPESYEFSATSTIKTKQEAALKRLNALQNGLQEAAKRAEAYRQKVCVALAS